MRDTSNQLKEMDNLINIYESTINDARDNFEADLTNAGLSLEFVNVISSMSDEVIKALDLTGITDILENTGCNPNALKEAYYYEKDKSIPFLEYATNILIKCKEKWEGIKESMENLEDIKEDRLDITRSFIDVLKSPEYRQARLDQIALLKEQAEREPDEVLKHKLLKKLEHIEKSQNFSFLNERLHTYGRKEADSIKSKFFSKSGEYIMERYYTRLRRLKINQAIHGSFFNLEEKFLPESYEPFNNFFLFHVIRWVSYIDTDNEADYLYMSSLIGALRDLVTDEATEEEKTTILNVMKDFYSFFEGEELTEYFKEHNANYKHHPDRIAAEKAAVVRRKEQALYNIKNELGSLYDENSEYGDPEVYLQQLINEKLSMIENIRNNGYTGRVHTYEEAFKVYSKMNSIEDSVDNVDEDELVDEVYEVDEDGIETDECCDESRDSDITTEYGTDDENTTTEE